MKKRAIAISVMCLLLVFTFIIAIASDNVEKEYIGTGSFSSYTVSRADITASPQNIVFVNGKGLDTYAFRLSLSFVKSAPDLYVQITDVTLTGLEYNSLIWIPENEDTPDSPVNLTASAKDGKSLKYMWSAECTFTSKQALFKNLTLTISLMSGKSSATAEKKTVTVPVVLSVADELSLSSAITTAKSIQNRECYTEQSLAALDKATADAAALLADIGNTSQSDVKAASDAVFAAIDGLTYKSADYSWVNSIVDSLPELSLYTDETAEPLREAVAAIDYNKNITEQSEVDRMAQNLITLKNALYPKEFHLIPSDGITVDEQELTVTVSLSQKELLSSVTANFGSVRTDDKILEIIYNGATVRTYRVVLTGSTAE